MKKSELMLLDAEWWHALCTPSTPEGIFDEIDAAGYSASAAECILLENNCRTGADLTSSWCCLFLWAMFESEGE